VAVTGREVTAVVGRAVSGVGGARAAKGNGSIVDCCLDGGVGNYHIHMRYYYIG
jgi:hypothetical protein